MSHSLSVLCPVDFSQGSRSALGFGAAIAEHFGARLVVMTVSDPLLAEVSDLRAGTDTLSSGTEHELRQFVRATFDKLRIHPADPKLITAVGKPAPEILRVARELACELIVMSSHGITGIRKLFFGATTERVLRETTIPVLVTHSTDDGPTELAAMRGTGRPVFVPLDLSEPGAQQVKVGAAVAEALAVPLLLSYVIEPLRYPVQLPISLSNLDAERRATAEARLADLATAVPKRVKCEALVAYGDPAEEVAKIARDRRAGVIVMGLHASTLTGPRMGSVTYRVLCLAPTMVLALPPLHPHP
jgi:nucleotide-binding universal stress UspA family protein